MSVNISGCFMSAFAGSLPAPFRYIYRHEKAMDLVTDGFIKAFSHFQSFRMHAQEVLEKQAETSAIGSRHGKPLANFCALAASWLSLMRVPPFDDV